MRHTHHANAPLATRSREGIWGLTLDSPDSQDSLTISTGYLSRYTGTAPGQDL